MSNIKVYAEKVVTPCGIYETISDDFCVNNVIHDFTKISEENAKKFQDGLIAANKMHHLYHDGSYDNGTCVINSLIMSLFSSKSTREAINKISEMKNGKEYANKMVATKIQKLFKFIVDGNYTIDEYYQSIQELEDVYVDRYCASVSDDYDEYMDTLSSVKNDKDFSLKGLITVPKIYTRFLNSLKYEMDNILGYATFNTNIPIIEVSHKYLPFTTETDNEEITLGIELNTDLSVQQNIEKITKEHYKEIGQRVSYKYLPKCLIIAAPVKNNQFEHRKFEEQLKFTDGSITKIYRLVSTITCWQVNGDHNRNEILTQDGWYFMDSLGNCKKKYKIILKEDHPETKEINQDYRAYVFYELVQEIGINS